MHKQWEVHKTMNQKQQNYHIGVYVGWGGGGGGRLAPNLRPRIYRSQNTNTVNLAWRLPNYCNASSQGNYLIKLIH